MATRSGHLLAATALAIVVAAPFTILSPICAKASTALPHAAAPPPVRQNDPSFGLVLGLPPPPTATRVAVGCDDSFVHLPGGSDFNDFWRSLQDESATAWRSTIGAIRDSVATAMRSGNGNAYSTVEESEAVASALDGAWRAIERYESTRASRDDRLAEYLSRGQPAVDPVLVRRLALLRMRERRSEILDIRPGLGPAAIDLESMLADVCPTADLDDCDAIESLMREHAEEVTELRVQWHRARIEGFPQDLRSYHRNRDDLDRFIEDRRRRGTVIVRIERSIIATNERWLDRFAEVLPQECVDHLLMRYRSAAFPKIYPCPLDITAVSNGVQVLPAGRLSPIDRSRLARVVESTEANLRTLRADLERLTLDHAELWTLTKSRRADDPEGQAIAEIRLRQAAVVSGLIAFVESLELSDDIEALASLVEIVASVMEGAGPARASDRP